MLQFYFGLLVWNSTSHRRRANLRSAVSTSAWISAIGSTLSGTEGGSPQQILHPQQQQTHPPLDWKPHPSIPNTLSGGLLFPFCVPAMWQKHGQEQIRLFATSQFFQRGSLRKIIQIKRGRTSTHKGSPQTHTKNPPNYLAYTRANEQSEEAVELWRADGQKKLSIIPKIWIHN